MRRLNCVTINTDASFCADTGASGFAFSIVCDVFCVKKAGSFKNPPKNAEEAEIMCIANAPHVLIDNMGEEISCKLVVINTDCLNGVKKIEEKRKYKASITANKLAKIASIKLNAKVEFRHVKAHTANRSLRAYA